MNANSWTDHLDGDAVWFAYHMIRLYTAYQYEALFSLMPLLSSRTSLSVCHFNNSVHSTLPLISMIIFPESEQDFFCSYSKHQDVAVLGTNLDPFQFRRFRNSVIKKENTVFRIRPQLNAACIVMVLFLIQYEQLWDDRRLGKTAFIFEMIQEIIEFNQY